MPFRLGVGICALDEERSLPRLLSRLLQGADALDRADLVVVADGGSTDSTPAVAERGGAEWIESPKGRGRQLGLAADRLLSGGAGVLLFLHADCVPRTGALAALRRAFEPSGAEATAGTASETPSESPSGPSPGACEVACMRQSIEAEGRRYRWIERAANARARRGMVYGDSGLAVSAARYEASGGFRPIPLFEDVDLSKRLRRTSSIRLVEDATLAISPRRWQQEGLLRCTIRNWTLRGLYEVGVSPEALVRLYRPFSRH